MTRDQIRQLVADVSENACPDDDAVIEMTSLQQLEFFFAIDELTEFKYTYDSGAIEWKTVNDVIRWLEAKGEYDPQ